MKSNLLKRLCNFVKAEIKAAPQKFVIPKENRHNSAFSFGIKIFFEVRLLFRILRYVLNIFLGSILNS